MSDEDLIFLINAGSQLALTIFYKRYYIYSKALAKEYALEFKDSGIQEDEFFAIAFERVQHALKKYQNIHKKFMPYWKKVVRNAVFDYVRVNSYQSGAKIYGEISLDSECYHGNEKFTFHDAIGEMDEENQLQKLLESYLAEDESTLTNEEKLILYYYFLEQRTIADISEITSFARTRVNYLIKTTRQKIQKIIKENYL